MEPAPEPEQPPRGISFIRPSSSAARQASPHEAVPRWPRQTAHAAEARTQMGAGVGVAASLLEHPMSLESTVPVRQELRRLRQIEDEKRALLQAELARFGAESGGAQPPPLSQRDPSEAAREQRDAREIADLKAELNRLREAGEQERARASQQLSAVRFDSLRSQQSANGAVTEVSNLTAALAAKEAAVRKATDEAAAAVRRAQEQAAAATDEAAAAVRRAREEADAGARAAREGASESARQLASAQAELAEERRNSAHAQDAAAGALRSLAEAHCTAEGSAKAQEEMVAARQLAAQLNLDLQTARSQAAAATAGSEAAEAEAGRAGGRLAVVEEENARLTEAAGAGGRLAVVEEENARLTQQVEKAQRQLAEIAGLGAVIDEKLQLLDAVEVELLREQQLVLEARAEVARSRSGEAEAVAELTQSEERGGVLAVALEQAAAENERLRLCMSRPLVVSYADPDQPASAVVDLSSSSGRSPGRSRLISPQHQAQQQDQPSGALEVIDARRTAPAAGAGV